MSAHTQLSCVYLTSTLDVTHVIKCTRLPSPLLSGESLGTRLLGNTQSSLKAHPKNLTLTDAKTLFYGATHV